MTMSMTVETGKLQEEIDAKNREIGDLWFRVTEKDAEIERLKARIDVLKSVRSAARAYRLADPKNDEYERQRLDYALAAAEPDTSAPPQDSQENDVTPTA